MAFSFAQPCPASLLRLQYLLRFDKLRVSGSNLQFDTAHSVLDVELRLVVKRLCLLHFAFGEEAVEEVPTDLHAGVPTRHVAAQVAAELGVAGTVAGEHLRAGPVAGPRAGYVFQ